MNNLFRQQAVEARLNSSSNIGVMNRNMPVSWLVVSGFMLITVVLVVLLLWFVEYPKIETVRGVLRFEQAEAAVFPTQDGTIAECFIADEQLVSAGDLLARISTEQFFDGGQPRTSVESDEIDEEIASLTSRVESSHLIAEISRLDSEKKISNANSLIKYEEANRELLVSRLRDAKKRKADAEIDLAEGLTVKAELFARTEAVVILKQSIIASDTKVAGLKATIDDQQIALKRIPVDLNNEQATLKQALSNAMQKLTSARARRGYALKSAISGIATNVNCRVGEVALSSNPLVTILPKESELVAELFLPSSAIAHVRDGATVKIRYDALPYGRYGVQTGRISEISSTSQAWHNEGASSNVSIKTYRVKVELGAQEVISTNETAPLRSGMELSADVVLENRRGIVWLLDSFRV